MNYELLYIHPTGLDYYSWSPVIPMGVSALMQSVDCRKIGLFYYGINKCLVKNAKIAALDLHWYFHLYPVAKISAYLKKVNPSIIVIIGGYTATILAEAIIKDFKIDFIIKGDAEYSFPLLVKKLLSSESIHNVPNVVAKDFRSNHDYSLTQESFEKYIYNDLSWFPELERIIHKAQRLEYPSWIGPWIPVSKGCRYYCSFCYGNPFFQEKINKRTFISRSADKVKEDLLKWSEDKKIRYVHFISDFLDLHGIDYAKAALGESYDLSVYYEFYNIPTIEEIDLFLKAFKYCYFWFTIEKNHSCENNLNNFEKFNTLFSYLKDKNCRIGLYIQPVKIFKYKKYFETLFSLFIKYRINLLEYNWDIKVPDPTKEQKAEFERFFSLSKRKINIFIYLKNRVIEIAHAHKVLFSLLMILNTYCVLLKCLFITCVQFLKEALIVSAREK